MSTIYKLTTGEQVTLSDDLLAEARELKALHPGMFRNLTVEQIAVTAFLARRLHEEKGTR